MTPCRDFLIFRKNPQWLQIIITRLSHHHRELSHNYHMVITAFSYEVGNYRQLSLIIAFCQKLSHLDDTSIFPIFAA